jgi:hypothetical protein
MGLANQEYCLIKMQISITEISKNFAQIEAQAVKKMF